VFLHHRVALLSLCLCLAAGAARAQSLSLPDAPQPPPVHLAAATPPSPVEESSSSSAYPDSSGFSFDPAQQQTTPTQTQPQTPPPGSQVPLDRDGNPIPLNHREPTRILGFMPNFRSVSVGAAHTRPGWKYNFNIATHQSFDYSSFLFLDITSMFAEGINEHPSLGKGMDGFYAYTWRGFLDKTDGTYLAAWLLPSLLHEDTRYYPLGDGHSIFIRSLYVISRQAVARDYSGHQTPNFANLGGKVLTQVISQYYYPDGTSGFGVLAEKFGYSVMRDVGFSAIREFYPDAAAHFVRKHHEKQARQAARDAQAGKPTP
jgi:hypothetical protein